MKKVTKKATKKTEYRNSRFREYVVSFYYNNLLKEGIIMKKSDKISRLDFLPLFYPTNKTASLITFDVNVFKFFSLPIFSKKYFSSRHIVNMWSILLSRHSNEIYGRVTEILQQKII